MVIDLMGGLDILDHGEVLLVGLWTLDLGDHVSRVIIKARITCRIRCHTCQLARKQTNISLTGINWFTVKLIIIVEIIGII